MEKTALVGVRVNKTGKLQYLESTGFELTRSEEVIIKTAKGLEYGTVEIATHVPQEVKSNITSTVVRVATKEDKAKYIENLEKEKKAITICQGRIEKHELNMKLIDTELTFDCTKIIFYFTSEQRVDFRKLVKDLASVFRMRIELRQIGVRDEAKAIGSIGMCGRKLCCSSFLGNFQPVSIKMAKDQGLSLNPSKISGVCGRLMCCLKYEEDVYEELNQNLPREFDIVMTPNGKGPVLSVNVLKQNVKVQTTAKDGSTTVAFYNVNEIKIIKKAHKQEDSKPLDKELQKLIES